MDYDLSREEAMNKIGEIASRYDLRTSILRDVMEGRTQGFSQRKIAETYGYSRNTVSKYSKIVNEEMSEDELGELAILVGAILGGALALKKILDDRSE